MKSLIISSVVCMALAFSGNAGADDSAGIQLKSGGPIAFGPDGLLFISDPMAATIYAVETGDTEKAPAREFAVENISAKIASLVGSEPGDIQINDLAVNQISGNAYLSVTRGSGTNAVSMIIRISGSENELEEFILDDVKHTKTTLPNPVASRQSRRGNPRMQAISDLAFIDEQLYVAGLSNEEFASNLRAIPYPFQEANEGASIEIYHGAHGKFETRSPIRTFAAYEVDGELNLLAAYTCTPLVRIPVKSLQKEAKVKGTTIAELGNRNRPLDMVVYKKDGNDFILMANSSRGVMKIKLADVEKQQGITSHVSGGKTAGLPYETIKDLDGIMQLASLTDSKGIVLVKDKNGNHHLKTIELP